MEGASGEMGYVYKSQALEDKTSSTTNPPGMFDQQALKGNGLACPYAKSEPERYRYAKQCHPDQGWNSIGKFSEHIWRFHSPLFNCLSCNTRWVSIPKKEMASVRAAHVKTCSNDRQSSWSIEIMSEDQERQFEKAKGIYDNSEKLREIYLALGKPIPLNYHVRPLAGDLDALCTQATEKQQPSESSLPIRTSGISISSAGFSRFDDNLPVAPRISVPLEVIISHFEGSSSGAGDFGYRGLEHFHSRSLATWETAHTEIRGIELTALKLDQNAPGGTELDRHDLFSDDNEAPTARYTQLRLDVASCAETDSARELDGDHNDGEGSSTASQDTQELGLAFDEASLSSSEGSVNTSDASSDIISIASSEGPQHSLFSQKDQILDLLFARYDAHRTHNGQSSGSSLSAADTPGAEQGPRKGKQVSRGKRRASEPNDDDGDDSGDSGGRQPKKIKTSGKSDANRVRRYFACPSFKKDHVKYSDCSRYRLLRIRDVKQHLRRRHKPPIYCPVCGETFETEEDRNLHNRMRTCQEAVISIEGITQVKEEKLSKRPPPGTNEEAQWFTIFAIVHPECHPPESAYLDPDLSEEMQSFRDFMHREGPSFLLEQLRPHVFNLRDDAFLDELLGDGLVRLASRWSRRLPLLVEPQTATDQLAGEGSQVRLQTMTPALESYAPGVVINEIPAVTNDLTNAWNTQRNYQQGLAPDDLHTVSAPFNLDAYLGYDPIMMHNNGAGGGFIGA